MNDRERDQHIDELLQVQYAALAAIPRYATAQPFLEWAQERLPKDFPEVFGAPTPEENARFAYWLARDIWNGAPLPTNRFRPKPLPRPKRNDACPCGSGKKFKNCCSSAPSGEWPQDVLWPLFARSQPAEYWLEVAHQLPTIGVAHVGECFKEEERWEAVVELLEPRFAAGQNPSSQLAEPVQWLCEAYDALHGTTEKKDALLARLSDCANNSVRAVANLRLASTRHDRGDLETAWRKADKAHPDDPAVALIELIMLTAELRTDRVMQRVDFWLARLSKDPDVSEESLDAIRSFKDNPFRATRLATQGEAPSDHLAERLFAWIDEACNRPLPNLKWRAMKGVGNDPALRDGHAPALSVGAKSLERQWRKRSGASKPSSIDHSAGDEHAVLANMADWLPWLEEHPKAADSLSILDDLATLLLNADAIDPDMLYCEMLIMRAVSTLLTHWPETRPGTLPWALEANRPALRLLAHGVDCADWGDGGEDDFKTDCVRLYLRLNRTDNHGLRTEFVDRLLVLQRNSEALQVADVYPNDMFAETTYGRVLALYRMGRLDDAEAALGKALARLPLPADYLLADHPAKPKEDPEALGGLVIGSEQQAWLYRREMRREWLATEGVMDWLRAHR